MIRLHDLSIHNGSPDIRRRHRLTEEIEGQLQRFVVAGRFLVVVPNHRPFPSLMLENLGWKDLLVERVKGQLRHFALSVRTGRKYRGYIRERGARPSEIMT